MKFPDRLENEKPRCAHWDSLARERPSARRRYCKINISQEYLEIGCNSLGHQNTEAKTLPAESSGNVEWGLPRQLCPCTGVRYGALTSYLYSTVQEGIGFPEGISNYRNWGSLEKLSNDPSPVSPRRHATLSWGHPASSGLAPPVCPARERWPVNFMCGKRLLVSGGSSLDWTPN